MKVRTEPTAPYYASPQISVEDERWMREALA